MKKLSKKTFLKFVAFVLMVFSVPIFRVNACEEPFPAGTYRIFNVAVIGSNIGVDGRPQDQPMDGGKSANEVVMDYFCGIDVGKKLEIFDGVEGLDGNKVSFAGRELPRHSMVLQDKGIIFCFYDVANMYPPEIIKNCPYAICPYVFDLGEGCDGWIKRMVPLIRFVKKQNEMCDIRLISLMKEYHDKEFGGYCRDLQQLASHTLDVYDSPPYHYQQTVNTYWIPDDQANEYCKFFIESLIKWDREDLFERYTQGKKFPTITSWPGTEPMYFQKGETSLSCAKPIIPPFQCSQPTPQSVVSSSKQLEATVSAACCSDLLSASIIYENFLSPRRDGTAPDGYEAFKDIIKRLIECGVDLNDILEGFKKIKLVERKEGNTWFWLGKPKKWILSATFRFKPGNTCDKRDASDFDIRGYCNTLFGNDGVHKQFEKVFRKCLDEDFTFENIKSALRGGDVYYREHERDVLYYNSGELSHSSQEKN